MDEKHGMSIKDLLIRLILIIIFIFLLIWLFPMPDLKPLNNQIFADNLDRMKDVAKSYYTIERLPKDINETKKMTLKEMIDKNYILPLMDSNGNYCNPDDSYVEITKLENEYVIKTYLSCSDKKDFIIEHYGCYDICSDKCKILETTAAGKDGDSKPVVKITTKKGKLYEYQFVKTTYDEIFDKYVCPNGYNLVSDKCIKNGSKVETIDAKKNVEYVKSTDTKDAKAVINSNTTLVDAECNDVYDKSTISAIKKEEESKPKEETVYEDVAAIKENKYEIKPALAKKTTTYSDYIITNKYDVITATKYLTGYTAWQYDHTHISTNPNEAYEREFEKKVLVKQYQDFTCKTCTTTVWKYMYFISTREGKYSYSCDKFPGYSLYEGNKCRKKLPETIKTCPTGFDPYDSTRCKKEVISDYSCAPYGSDYVYNASDKSCKKLIGTQYTCPSGTNKTSNEKVCKKPVTNYTCPTGKKVGDKCIITKYSCPPNTADTKYTLSGDKCIVETKTKVCKCPPKTSPTNDPNKCAKDTSTTTYSCAEYPGYTLAGSKCVNTITTEKITYTCNSGYALNGTSCTKTVNVNDTKDAEKTYKIISDTKYKWSTKTWLGDGWVFTGNVREIK